MDQRNNWWNDAIYAMDGTTMNNLYDLC